MFETTNQFCFSIPEIFETKKNYKKWTIDEYKSITDCRWYLIFEE